MTKRPSVSTLSYLPPKSRGLNAIVLLGETTTTNRTQRIKTETEKADIAIFRIGNMTKPFSRSIISSVLDGFFLSQYAAGLIERLTLKVPAIQPLPVRELVDFTA